VILVIVAFANTGSLFGHVAMQSFVVIGITREITEFTLIVGIPWVRVNIRTYSRNC